MNGFFSKAASFLSASVLAAACTVSFPAEAANAHYCDAQDDKEAVYESFYDVGDTDISAYTGNARIWIDRVTADPDKLSADSEFEVSVHVSGAADTVGKISLHFIYDTRLTLVTEQTAIGNVLMKTGDAVSEFTNVVMSGGKEGSLYLMSNHVKNILKDGTLCTMKFKLPSDVKGGEVFPVGIEYITKSGGSDCFCDAFNSEEAKLQEAYIFTEGITNGYIKVSGEDDFVLGDVNNDGSIDSGDASDILLAYSNTQTGSSTGLDERAEKAANVNGDQYIDSNDASVVLAYYAYTQTGGHGSLEEYLSSDPGQ